MPKPALNDIAVLAVRRAAGRGVSFVRLSKIYKVSPATIARAVNFDSYPHNQTLAKAYSPKADPKGETTPEGISASTPGAKLDAGKERPALVLGEFSRALAAVVEVGTVGANKYTPRGWLQVANGQERYADAAFRHQLKVWKGEKIDEGPGGTGKLHKAQVLWNLLAELELELRAEESVNADA